KLQRLGLRKQPQRTIGKLERFAPFIESCAVPTCLGPMIGRSFQSIDVSFAQPGHKTVDRVRELLAISQRVTEEVGLLCRRAGEMVGDEPKPDRAGRQSDALELLANQSKELLRASVRQR